MQPAKVTVEQFGAVGLIRLNSPQNLNAFDAQMTREFAQALADLNADSGIRAIVTTGTGRAYSAGADLRRSRSEETPDQQPPRDVWDPYYLALESKPLIAAVNGIAVGVGLTSILWYDMILASTLARFSMRFAAIGRTPELGSTWILPRIVGVQNAREMMLTGKIYNADEAREMGLVRQLYAPEALVPAAIDLGQAVASNPASTVKHTRSMIFRDYFAQGVDEVIARSNEAWEQSGRSPDAAEAIAAFREKRAARFHSPT